MRCRFNSSAGTLTALSGFSSQTVRILDGFFCLILKREMQTLLNSSPLHMDSPSPKNSLPLENISNDSNPLNPIDSQFDISSQEVSATNQLHRAEQCISIYEPNGFCSRPCQPGSQYPPQHAPWSELGIEPDRSLSIECKSRKKK